MTIADFNGDARPEIGIGRWPNYVVVEADGPGEMEPGGGRRQRSFRPWPSAFDFDGDGADEAWSPTSAGLHVLSGRDGALLGERAVGSCSGAHGYPAGRRRWTATARRRSWSARFPAAAARAAAFTCSGRRATAGCARAGDLEGVRLRHRGEAAGAPTVRDRRVASRCAGSDDVVRRRNESGRDILFTAADRERRLGTARCGRAGGRLQRRPASRGGFRRLHPDDACAGPGEYEDVVLRLPSTRAA